MPLSGLRVVDLTRVLTGPFCSMLLAGRGAEVGQGRPQATGRFGARLSLPPDMRRPPRALGRQAGVAVAKSLFAFGIKPS
jgi:crotonobetainyl-CoA:carnitine CoA-transferase CaiB-like acyl-CoA transferase